MSKEFYHENIPPSTKEINGLIYATNMDLRTAVAELIANSLDQNSTQIDLALDKRHPGTFTISDNGNGCAALKGMIKIGSHVAAKNDSIGRFGVGFKDAVIWLGDRATVDSMTKKGKKEMAIADWQEMIHLDQWRVHFKDDSARIAPGVTVEVTDLRPKRFRAWKEVPRYIAELFSAAIDAGITITVDGKAIKSIPQPLLTDSQEFAGTFGGLSFKGVAGILADKKAALSGWEIRYSPQTIAAGYTKAGFGTYSSQGFYGRLLLLDGERRWKLNRNKTAAEDLDDVLNCPYVQSVIQPILEKLKTRGENLAIRLNQLHVQTYLTNLLQKLQVRITDEEESGGKRGKRPTPPDPEPGPGPKPPRKKRVYDPLSNTKGKIKAAQSLHIFPHEDPKGRGLGYVEVTEHGTAIKIYIDRSTKAGISIWANHTILFHHAINALSVYFGLQVDILGQLRLPIGQISGRDEVKISQAALYLFEHVDLNEFETIAKAAA